MKFFSVVPTKTFQRFAGRVVIVALATVALACSGQKFSLDGENKNFGTAVTYSSDVEVLLVVDTSSSMEKHQAALAAQMPALVSALNATQQNYRIAVTTMDMGSGGAKGHFVGSPAVLSKGYPSLGSVLSSRVQLGQNGSSVERGLEAMKAATSAPLSDGANFGFLRPDSLLVVIFLSNEDDSSSSQNYEAYLNSIRPPAKSGAPSWIVNFIGVLPNDTSCQTADWNYFAPGTRYKALADVSGGRSENICTANLSSAVSNIKSRVIEILSEYSLGDREPDLATLVVQVNGALIANSSTNGWTYNQDRNSLTFHGAAIPQPGATIHVDFTPKEIK